jgi:hypothetical protein
MEVGYRQQFIFTSLYPFFALLALAFRAMTITTTVIADTKQTA